VECKQQNGVKADNISRYRTVKYPGLKNYPESVSRNPLPLVNFRGHLLSAERNGFSADPPGANASILVSCDCVKDHVSDHVMTVMY